MGMRMSYLDWLRGRAVVRKGAIGVVEEPIPNAVRMEHFYIYLIVRRIRLEIIVPQDAVR